MIRNLYTHLLHLRGVPQDCVQQMEQVLFGAFVLLQRRFRHKQRLKQYLNKCSDCKSKITYGYEIPACIDFNCCVKTVCSTGYCGFRCPNGHLVYTPTCASGYYDLQLACKQCHVFFLPSFHWYGAGLF